MTEPLITAADIAWSVFTVSLACAELLVAYLDERRGDRWSAV